MEEEISLKDLILEVGTFLKEFRKNWIWILLSGIIMAGVFYFNYIRKPLTYNAQLTFMINGEEGSSGSGLGGLLGAFGLGGGGGGGSYNLEKLTELALSRKIVGMSLFEKIPNDGKTDYVANHLIDQYDFHKTWEENEVKHLEGFYFKDGDLDSFDRTENQVLKMVYRRIIGNTKAGIPGIANVNYNEISRIFRLNTFARSEEMSIALNKLLYKNLSKFYVEKSVENYQRTYDIMKSKVDSLDIKIKQKNYELLAFEDSNRNLSLRKYQARKLSLQGEISKLAASYTEAFKSLEVTELALKNNTPVIVTIDEPIPPLMPSVKSVFNLLLMGGLLGAMIAIIFLSLRKIYRNIMADT